MYDTKNSEDRFFWSFYFMYSQTLQLRARIRKSHPTRVIQYIHYHTHLMASLEALAYRYYEL